MKTLALLTLLPIVVCAQSNMSDTILTHTFTSNALTVGSLNAQTYVLTNGKGGVLTQSTVPDTLNNPRYTNWLWSDTSYNPPWLKQWTALQSYTNVSTNSWRSPAISGTAGIGSSQIADAAITSAKLASNAVDAWWKISNGVVQTVNIGNNAVLNSKLAANVIATTNILDGAVTSAKVPDNGLPVVKLETTYASTLPWYYANSNALNNSLSSYASNIVYSSNSSNSLKSATNSIIYCAANGNVTFGYGWLDNLTGLSNAQPIYANNYQLVWFTCITSGGALSGVSYTNCYTNRTKSDIVAWTGPKATGVATNGVGTNCFDSIYITNPGYYRVIARIPMGSQVGYWMARILYGYPADTTNRLVAASSPVNYIYTAGTAVSEETSVQAILHINSPIFVQVEVYTETAGNYGTLGMPTSSWPTGLTNAYPHNVYKNYNWQSLEIQKLDPWF